MEKQGGVAVSDRSKHLMNGWMDEAVDRRVHGRNAETDHYKMACDEVCFNVLLYSLPSILPDEGQRLKRSRTGMWTSKWRTVFLFLRRG